MIAFYHGNELVIKHKYIRDAYDRKEVIDAMERLQPKERGNTFMRQALAAAYTLINEIRDTGTYHNSVLLLTDGEQIEDRDPTETKALLKREEAMSEKKLSVIWNVTGKCPWTCEFCCMDSGPQNCLPEMSLEEKFHTARQLGAYECRVDLSGGEVMANRKDHFPLIEQLSADLGRENLGISCSGVYIDDAFARKLAPLVSNVEMTMDAHPERCFPWRPAGYHKITAKAVKALLSAGIETGLQTVTTIEHKREGLLEELYGWICSSGVTNWSILKFFPSGRGVAYPELELSDEDCRSIVSRIKAMDAANPSESKPAIDFHYLMPGSEKPSACRCVKRSIGILPDGRVTSCFWGLDRAGKFLDDKFYLGNLVNENLGELLIGPKAYYWLGYCGACAIGDIAAPEPALSSS